MRLLKILWIKTVKKQKQHTYGTELVLCAALYSRTVCTGKNWLLDIKNL